MNQGRTWSFVYDSVLFDSLCVKRLILRSFLILGILRSRCLAFICIFGNNYLPVLGRICYCDWFPQTLCEFDCGVVSFSRFSNVHGLVILG